MKSNSNIERMLYQDAEKVHIDLEFKKDLKKRIIMQGKEKETVKRKGKLVYLRRVSAAAVIAIVFGGTSIGLSSKLNIVNKDLQDEKYALNEVQKKDDNDNGIIGDIYLKKDDISLKKSNKEKVSNIEDNDISITNAANEKQNSLNSNITNNDNIKTVKDESKDLNKSQDSVIESKQNAVSEEKFVQNNVVTDIDKVYAVSGNGEALKASEIDKNNSGNEEDTMTKTLIQEENKIYIMDIKTEEKVQIDEGRKAELIENQNYVAYIKDELDLGDNNLVTTSQSMNLEKNNSSVWIYNVKTKEKQLIIKCSDIENMNLEKNSSNKEELPKSMDMLLGKTKVEGAKYTFSGFIWSKSTKQLYLLVNNNETNKENLIRLKFKVETEKTKN